MRQRGNTIARCLLVLLAVSGAPVIAAKPTPANQEAAVRYGRGIALYKDGDYAAALAEFRAAYRASPSFEVLYNIGLCERRLYKYGDAVKNLDTYLSLGGAKVPKERRDAVARELAEIRSLTAAVTIVVVGEPADVTIDGEAIGTSPFPSPFLLGPGKKVFKAHREGFQPGEKTEEIVSGTQVTVALEPKHKTSEPATLVLESSPKGAIITVDGKLAGTAPVSLVLEAGGHMVIAELAGHQPWRQDVTLAEGQKRTVSIALEAEVVAKGRAFPVAGVVVAGVGALAIGGAVALNLQAQAASREVNDLFQAGGTWDAHYAQVEKTGLSAQAWSIVVGVAGGVALTTGLVLTVVTLASNAPAEEGEEAAPAPPAEEAHLFFTPLPEGGVYGGVRFKW